MLFLNNISDSAPGVIFYFKASAGQTFSGTSLNETEWNLIINFGKMNININGAPLIYVNTELHAPSSHDRATFLLCTLIISKLHYFSHGVKEETEGKEVRQAFKQEKDYACTNRRDYSLACFYSVLFINWIGGMGGIGT